MSEKDPLRDKTIETGGGGLFFKVAKGESAKVRVLTVDPLVSKDKYGNIRFAFVIWNYTEDKAQIVNKGASFARTFQNLHNDADYGEDIRKIDLKISATSTGPEAKDVEYNVNPLPKAEQLTNEQVQEAANIKLEEIISDGERFSSWMPEKKEDEPKEDRVATVEDADNEPINLDDIPF